MNFSSRADKHNLQTVGGGGFFKGQLQGRTVVTLLVKTARVYRGSRVDAARLGN